MSSKAGQIAKRIKDTHNKAHIKDKQRIKANNKPRKRTKSGVIYIDNVK